MSIVPDSDRPAVIFGTALQRLRDNDDREYRLLSSRLEDLERQMAVVLAKLNKLPDPSMPHRSYPARLESNG